MSDKCIVMVASYGGPYAGNFIASLEAYDKKVKEHGYRTVYVFPTFVEEYSWTSIVKEFADKVYFLEFTPRKLSNIKALKQIFKEENASLVYCRMSGWDIPARIAAGKLPVIWHMEMNLYAKSKAQKIKNWIKYNIFDKKNTYNISVSPDCSRLMNNYHLNHECITIQNAVSLDRLHKKKDEHKVSKNLLVFGYNPYIKGLDIALDACHVLEATDDFKLLVSAQKPTHEYLDDRYDDKLPDFLEVLEPTDDIASVYDMADVLICSSRSEGFSFAIEEAVYSGLKVIYSDIEANDWVKDFHGTISFKTQNSKDLAKVVKLAVKMELNDDMMEYNRKFIEENYSMNAWSDKIYSFIKDIEEK